MVDALVSNSRSTSNRTNPPGASSFTIQSVSRSVIRIESYRFISSLSLLPSLLQATPSEEIDDEEDIVHSLLVVNQSLFNLFPTAIDGSNIAK